ncbi:serine/arginine repetitive matrix protein 2 [Nocardioidaceae bacterium Broad-1]|nr:serine/arginine repetitive matrix protein 2 [Nocardioidaceae bacterium Broad-1]
MTTTCATFTSPEGLRALLNRLHDAGANAWRDDPEVADLMKFTIRKYTPLARYHRQQPEDAAVAAYEAMLTSSVRNAINPWAVVTQAVRTTLIADERADGLLCSTHKARRSSVTAFLHDAVRFGEQEYEFPEYHAALQAPSLPHLDEGPGTRAYAAADQVACLLTSFGWPASTAEAALEFICSRLIDSGSRPTAHLSLRRDPTALAVLDVSQRCWTTTLRLVLGSPNPELAQTSTGQGLLQQLALGYTIREVLDDDRVVRALQSSVDLLLRRPSHV